MLAVETAGPDATEVVEGVNLEDGIGAAVLSDGCVSDVKTDPNFVTPQPTVITVPPKEDELVEAAKEAGESLTEAAAMASTDEERARVMAGLSDTPRLTESGIAPEVLAKLLPDDEIVVLPRVSRIAGGLGYRFIKRAFDVVSCGAALIILAIPMAIIAAKIKSESAGPVIYAQRRVGLNGKVFEVYKFRSMYTDAEAKGAQWATEGESACDPIRSRDAQDAPG